MGCGCFSASSWRALAAGVLGRGFGPTGIGLQSLAGIPVPEELQKRRSYIAKTEQRGISVAQLKLVSAFSERVFGLATCIDSRSGQVVEWGSASKYNVNDFITTPLTEPFGCSTVELVAEAPQQPTWFVSHAWSHGLRETVVILAFHAEAREGAEATCYYWICTFANNQHNLSQLAGALEETPFFKVITADSCRGTVAMVCGSAALFKRVWCLYESYLSLELTKGRGKPHLYDLGTWCSGLLAPPIEYMPGAAIQLDLGNGEYKLLPDLFSVGRWDETLHLNAGKPGVAVKPAMSLPPGNHDLGQAARVRLILSAYKEKEVQAIDWHMPLPPIFPVHAGLAAFAVNVSTAMASRDQDRRAILHSIASTPPSEWDDEPPLTHEGYDKLNRRIQHRFAELCIMAAICSGDAAKMQEAMSRFPGARSQATSYVGVASFNGHVEALRLLLAAGADVKHDPLSPLCLALLRGHTAIVAELLDAGADPEDQTFVPFIGRTPLDVARLRGADDECAALLLRRAVP
uniref:Uncharacterized protein n=1 Tax=Zooxanthella nutricula TaxID=1333877 RepID=A0A7S2M8I7_9DINO|mmetsp:Transcript_74399/g.227632  ORF Transcript_74399/g.227632 Transcript_74399/m.227632 type:complete len:518 (+) Transcript_74399:60-1613(+)